MNETRARMYDNAAWLVDRSADADVDPQAVIEFLAGILSALRDGERAIVLPTTPALEQWRQRTLEDRTADPLARAAAWELSAVQCEQSDALDLAAKCRDNAVYAMRPRRVA